MHQNTFSVYFLCGGVPSDDTRWLCALLVVLKSLSVILDCFCVCLFLQKLVSSHKFEMNWNKKYTVIMCCLEYSAFIHFSK